MNDDVRSLGWWCIRGEDLLFMLHRVADGEDPDMVYTETYANADREDLYDE